MSFTRKANYVVEQAKALAPNVTNWADFSAEIFGQKEGLIAKTFCDEAERQLFYDSEQYKAVNQLRLRLMKKFGVEAGATPEKSGRVLVRLPKALHSALEVEALKEGVSINQLAVSKLSLPLRDRVDLSIPVIVEAFTKVYDGYSTDRVVVDPGLNARFLGECRRLGMKQNDYWINHALLDIRKSKKAVLPRATRRSEFRDYSEYQFASEIAVRILQRSRGISLDQILCAPATALEFDHIAKQLAPRQTALKLRMAALNLRKTRRLGKMRKFQDVVVDLVVAKPVRVLRPSDLPDTPGVYSFFDEKRPLFAGQARNLEHRIALHLEGRMPNWLGVEEGYGCVLKYAPMPGAKSSERQAWLYSFIRKERPLLNFQRSA